LIRGREEYIGKRAITGCIKE